MQNPFNFSVSQNQDAQAATVPSGKQHQPGRQPPQPLQQGTGNSKGETQAEQRDVSEAETAEEELSEESSEEEVSVVTPDRPEAKLAGVPLYRCISNQLSTTVKITLLLFFVL